MTQGNIFNIQRYTIHDGPGIRTEIFMKGCPLSCKWCGNPESLSSKIQMGYYASKCLGVQKCNLCEGKKDKPELCPTDAIKQWGELLDVEDVMKLIRRDVSYYESSGGGVTISGGEPLMQPDFTAAILQKCRKEGIHTCLESTFCTDWSIIEKVIPYADMFISDIKLMDSKIHEKYTGIPNDRILDNLSKLVELGKPIILRIPVIPGVNDNMENMAASADFILDKMANHIEVLQLLPFMRLGEEKYASLGMEYPMKDIELDRGAFNDRIREFEGYFNKRGIACITGTKEKK